ncbi:MAG: efflux RND transporter periplasmic adaptor subunit [Acidiferrobacterales bacterium]
MKKLFHFALLVACAGLIGSRPALADDGGVSVSVNLIPLQKGRLPTSVTTYGRVVPSQKARKMLSAPVATRVGNIEVRQGEMVNKGTPLVTLVPSPGTRTTYRQAELALKVARQLLARSRQLATAHLETAARLAGDEKAEADAETTLAMLQEEGANGPNTLKAPFDAVVLHIDASSGSFVAQGTPVIELARPTELVFKTGVVPAQAAEIKIGDKAAITPFGGSGISHGKVVLRGSVVSTASGLVPIEISLPDGPLLTGEMGKVVINTGVKQGYIVPHDAVLLNTSGQTYIVQSIHDVAKLVPVAVITSKGDRDLVEGNLVAGAPVVGTGNYELANGTRMRAAGETGGAPGSGSASIGKGRQ